MTAYLDKKYINLIKYRFKDFKWKSSNLANAKCVFCEHDNTNHKARGYFILKENHFYYYCHNNPQDSCSIKNLLKQLDLNLYTAYKKEEFEFFGKKENPSLLNETAKISYLEHKNAEWSFKQFKKISSLPLTHPAKKYIDYRKIPNIFHAQWRWVEYFMCWTNTLVPNKFQKDALKHDHGRIVIPFYDQKKCFFAYTGRVIGDRNPRYALIVLDHDVPLLYGLDRVNFNKPTLAVEGPIDSTFLQNCVALCGSNIAALTKVVEPDMVTIIYDNEPDKPETKGKIIGAINLGFKVCIWPTWVKYKDINEMVINEWDPLYIQDIIKENTFKGYEAKIRTEAWSKR